MGHTLGAVFHIPHGRAVGLCLPSTIEYAASQAPQRFADLEALLSCSLPADRQEWPEAGARALARRVRALCQEIQGPTSIAELGIERAAYEASLEKLVDDASNDTQIITAVRSPTRDELSRLFRYLYEGQVIDF